jgi:protein gp37/ParB-like chromosome segregation protein Spo0J
LNLIPLSRLHQHAQNPRLGPRQDVVDRLAAQIGAAGSFDEAHALIVRPLEDRFQIISGHHRKLAAEKAGLAEVPCHVREMGDAEAYMQLVLCNTQGELNSLERGLHALGATEKGKWGKSAAAYAKEVGRAQRTVAVEIAAARVAKVSTDVLTLQELVPYARQLAELHAAPDWCWPALVARLVADGWTIDAAKAQVKRLAGAPKDGELPRWIHREKLAEAMVSGAAKPNVLAAMMQAVDRAKLVDADLKAALSELLSRAKPSRLSEVQGIIGELESEQAKREAAERERKRKKQQEKEEAEARTARLRHACSLDEWKELKEDERAMLLDLGNSTSSFNAQENDAIEWAQWSWNPVTGCLHDCPYCYARDIAVSKRMADAYPTGFAPTLKPHVLLAPRNKSPKGDATFDTREKNVFTCSMADLFGRWVPEEWIEAVFREVRNAPEWNFLFLTKFPKRMAEFAIPENAWMGTTVDLQARVPAAEAAFAKVKAGVRWLSIEPMLEPLRFKRLDLFQWIVIGGASKSSQTPEWKPPYAWVHDLVQQAREAGVKVYFKTNLLGNKTRILELPFDAPIASEKAELPEVFRYLGKTASAA